MQRSIGIVDTGVSAGAILDYEICTDLLTGQLRDVLSARTVAPKFCGKNEIALPVYQAFGKTETKITKRLKL